MEWMRFHEWLNLFIRWFHVVAGITWLGQIYLFNWMEKTLSLEAGDSNDENLVGKLWMVHGGGFYTVRKLKIPERSSLTLRWFKWESALTWISGFILLTVVYYMGDLMLESDSELSVSAAIAIGLGALLFGWFSYSLIWSSPLGKNEKIGSAISFILVLGMGYLMDQFISSRAAFMHIGAMLGTVMAANVWLVILPAQRQIISATQANAAPDMTLAERARRSSKHNTYMSVPLILIMISSHFPTITYGNPHKWLMLGGFLLIGSAAAKWMRG